MSGVYDENGDFTDFRLDLVGRQVEMIDPAGNVTRQQYDAWDRLTLDTIIVGGFAEVEEYQYDATDNVVYRRDRNEREYDYTYDNRDRRTVEAKRGEDETGTGPVV